MTNQILINKTNNPAVENNLKIIYFVKDMVKLLKLSPRKKKMTIIFKGGQLNMRISQ